MNKVSSTKIFGASQVVEKYFQLEELEDKDTSTTELFLCWDGVVQVGETDGPQPIAATGTWEVIDNNTFKMKVTRTFEAGKKSNDSTDVGEFSFDVVRSFTGETTFVGNAAAITGSMHVVDDLGDAEVGYFNMIDTTDERIPLE